MRYLKFGLISIVVMSIVLFLLSLTLPSHVRISRAINISAPADSILPHLSNMYEWKKWNALLSDSATVASTYLIRDNQVDILKTEWRKPNQVTTRWVQKDGKEFQSAFELVPGKEFTVVQWYFDFNFRWYVPWEKFGSIIYDKRMGPSMEKSLTQLKGLVETSL